jgi:hypothetical protein
LRRQLVTCLALISLTACSTLYQPLKPEEKTGLYPTSVQVDAGGVTIYDTSADPKAFRHVLLLTDSNIRPSVFAFTVRQALAHGGITRVYTSDEFLAIAEDRRLASAGAQINTELVQRFAKEIGSVLVVDYRYQYLGDARFHSRLSATDAANGRVLLRVDHPRLNWANADTEAMYPVLNQLRRWMNESGKGRT